jgi:hypothetical protein
MRLSKDTGNIDALLCWEVEEVGGGSRSFYVCNLGSISLSAERVDCASACFIERRQK